MGHGNAHLDITCVTRVLGSAPDAHASMSAWRLDPLPDMRTVRLCCFSAMTAGGREEREGECVGIVLDWV